MLKEIKYRGISRAMSDMGVADGGLAECANLMLDHDEIAPIVPPKKITALPDNLSYDLLFIHKSPGFDGEHYICLYNNSIYYLTAAAAVNMLGTNGALDSGEVVKDVKAVGNTVIATTNSRMRYFLWTTSTVATGAYKYLGSNIPSLEVKVSESYDSFTGSGTTSYTNPRTGDTTTTIGNPNTSISIVPSIAEQLGISEGDALLLFESFLNIMNGRTILYPGDDGYSAVDIAPNNNDTNFSNDVEPAYAASVAGAISQAIWTQIATLMGTKRAQSKFCTPVLVRCAIRLYDGSYIKHTVPILVGIKYASSLIRGALLSGQYTSPRPSTGMYHTTNYATESATIPRTLSVCLAPFYSLNLLVQNAAEIAQWSDIVKGVDIFLSEPVYLNKYGARISSFSNTTMVVNFETLSDDEKLEELLGKSVFYRVAQYDIANLSATQIALDNLTRRIGDNLPVQFSLPDDYRSNHEVWPEKMYEMNGRLNILNIHTRYYQGSVFPASQIDAITGKTVIVKFRIRGEAGTEIRTYTNYGANLPGAWLVYPDTRCYMVDVYIATTSSGTYTAISLPMKEHPLLNCAYSFLGFGINDLSGYAGVSSSPAPTTTQLLDHAYNKIFQSEIDNPFFFPLAGRHSISGGHIIGVASTTKALSQGQFGQFPLYVFCSEGVWAMQTAADGTFQSIVPVSRVVCNNANSITGIDGAVVFSSDRGLMLLTGSDVTCLSEDMIGKHFRADSLSALEEIAATHFGSTLPGDVSDSLSFVDYIAECYIAYDFANARLILLNPNCEYQYIYNLSSRTWHKMCFGLPFKRAVNSFPDCYMQCESNDGDAVYNFSIIDDVNDINVRTFGVLVTRALDFDEPFILKTIQAIRHRGNYDSEHVRFLLYGSRDGIHYIPVHSLKGKSFKFYRIAIMASLLPTERINRTTVQFDNKFGNKLR